MDKIKTFLNDVKDFIDPYCAAPWTVKINIPITIILVALSAPLYWLMTGEEVPLVFRFLWFANIGIHEVGHPIFNWISFGNEFMRYAGGTLAEILVPAGALFYFLRQGKSLQADVCFTWLGYSFYSIGHYAKSTSLPEVTLLNAGPDTISDWEYFHDYFGTELYDITIGHIFYCFSAVIIVFGIYCFFYHITHMRKRRL
ncbi:hypothetical protein Dip510_002069 [Elusimicrobium posterum]|uniref:hypothetical protein n=1 Tax=Elusimicrobium posterum TaxID=3116653 RepID=UPI003C72AD06